MARGKFLELPEELYNAIERAALAQGKTTAEWLDNNLSLSIKSDDIRDHQSDLNEVESEAQRELWLTQL